MTYMHRLQALLQCDIAAEAAPVGLSACCCCVSSPVCPATKLHESRSRLKLCRLVCMHQRRELMPGSGVGKTGCTSTPHSTVRQQLNTHTAARHCSSTAWRCSSSDFTQQTSTTSCGSMRCGCMLWQQQQQYTKGQQPNLQCTATIPAAASR